MNPSPPRNGLRLAAISPTRLLRHVLPLLLALALLRAPASAHAGDWPAYRHDVARSAVTDEKLAVPLGLAWEVRAAQPPAPAWPEPVKLLNRLDFDYAPQPVIAGGIVCIASSSDDTVRAFDAVTGRERWHFITGGPVRIAPQLAGGKVYFGSDDGLIYCLDAATGHPAWTFLAARNDERILGNERMISRWPVRTGVLVDKGVAYCTAGMWSSEGVFVYALDALTGKVIWCNDTSGFINGVRELHLGADFAAYGVCPQGPLAASDDVLLVPAGKALPAGFDRKTGRFLYYNNMGVLNQRGGSWVVVDGTRFHTMPMVGSYSLETGQRAGGYGLGTLPPPGARVPNTLYFAYEKPGVAAIVHGGKAILRRAFDLIQAGSVLIEGQENAVVALDAKTRAELWRVSVEGEARALAVADGRLYVCTSLGHLYCFAAGMPGSPGVPATPSGLPADKPEPTLFPPGKRLAGVLASLKQAGIDRGYALVLGDDGSLSQGLAHHTGLHIITPMTNPDEAEAVRNGVLVNTSFYGSRIHVQHIEHADALPYGDYFANTVILAGPVKGLNAKELYRVLHPCGGLLFFPGLPAEEAKALAAASGAEPGEDQADGPPRVLRGRLPGALDWDSPYITDQRVKWPMRLLWFGGPGPSLVLDRKEGNVIGPVAFGRYFVQSEAAVSAVDAYNGTILWTRPIPRRYTVLRLADATHTATDGSAQNGVYLQADAEAVYITAAGFFPEKGRAAFQLDARTGEQRKFFGPYIPPPVVRLASPQTLKLDIDAARGGVATLMQEPDALRIDLVTRDARVVPLDRWDLFFDCRPESARYGLYGRGTFELQIQPSDGKRPAVCNHAVGEAFPRVELTGKHTAAGTTTTLRIPWREVEALAGTKTTSLGFALRLNAHDGGAKENVVRQYLFCDVGAEGINNGWANVVLGDAPEPGKPAVVAGAFEQRTGIKPRARVDAPLAGAPMFLPRKHPLTDEPGVRLYQKSGVCGGTAFSDQTAFTRSTALGIYDFADDSGMRVFDGVKPSCTGSTTAALGLLLSSEGRGGCECTTNFQTSLAMAPTTQRSNEDWALFFDLTPDAPIRRASLNLGAPGDRRAEDGTLWLGFPRVLAGHGIPTAPRNVRGVGYRQRAPGVLQVPLEVEYYEGGGPFRINADRTAIDGTDKPWLYSSTLRGLKSATLKLDARAALISQPLATPPTIDGKLARDANAEEWPGPPQTWFRAMGALVHLRHDNTNLYIATHREAVVDEKGTFLPWTKTATGEDARVDLDCSLEVFLSDAARQRVVHLGVSASGARFDALAKGNDAEDVKWNGVWTSGVVADDKGFTIEMAIPWSTLAEAGIDKASLGFNAQMNGHERSSDTLTMLGYRGRNHCDRFIPVGLGGEPASPTRTFTVRLHWAELEEIKPGQRVFDVKLQGETVLKDFDVVKEAGSPRKAVTREFKHVQAREALKVELFPGAGVPGAGGGGAGAAAPPILGGIEVVEEDPPAADGKPSH
ncbi:MAG: PQQ-binding-like beta-propeller repeat protein [Planctomycetota bacterium]|nr:PQQ-binding-like beta-propeller repeat protein [Planctomycetota bacterium]